MMKQIVFPFLVAIIAMGATSCDQCIGMFGKEKVICSNGGTCNDGECDCLKGYDGPTCDSLNLCELNDVECVYGTCAEGLCECQSGYESKLCETETRAKFMGKFDILERCAKLDTVQNHDITITRDLLDATKIEIHNLFNANQFPIYGFYSKIEARATPYSMNFVIFNQNPDDNERSISGSGTIDMNDTNNIFITIDYTVVSGNKEYDCNVIATRFE